MDYLREYAEELGLRQVVGGLAEQPNVQGAILTLDDWWLTAWRLEESGRVDELERWLWHWRHWGPGPYPFIYADVESSVPAWIPLRAPSLGWRPRHWAEFCHMSGRDEETPPVRLIVALRPALSGEKAMVPELPQLRLPVSFEVRPLARLSSAHRAVVRPIVGGVSIGVGPREFGTLGGVVEDAVGTRYGMTCSHVLPPASSVHQPAPYDSAKGGAIGGRSASIALQPCPGTGPCNPYNQSPHISSVDSTLIELKTGVTAELEVLSIGRLAGVVQKASLTPGQEVMFVGRTSGLRIAELGGLAVFYRLHLSNAAYCFRDLFEIRWRSLARSILGPVVQAGDSGAWVLAETASGPGWCGQVLGEDRRVGYAAFAENTLAAWSGQGKDLRVI